MSNEEDHLTPLSPAERELESALGRLAPVPPAFTPAQVVVRSLVSQERRRTRLWQGVAAVLAIGASAAFWNKPAPRVVEVRQIVYRDAQPIPQDHWVVADRTGVFPETSD